MSNSQTSYSDVRLRFDAVIETATDGIIIIDERGIMELVNPAAAALFEYSVEEMIGHNIHLLMPAPHREMHDTYVKNYLTTGIKHIIGIGREVNGLKKNGDLFPFRLSISEVFLHDRRIFTGIIHDLSEQKKAEQALQEEKDRAQRYLDVANSLFIVITKDGTVALINKKGTEILGYSESELVGKNWFDVCVPQEARAKRRQSFQAIMQGQELRFDYFENPVRTKYGDIRLFAFRNSLLRDADGNAYAIISSAVDISEQRAAEERIRQLNAELENRVEERTEELAEAVNQLLNTNHKLEFEIQERKSIEDALRKSETELRNLYEREKELNNLKSRFVAMASHEFRTPLSAILSSADLIEAYTEKEQLEKRLKHTGRIKSAVSNLTSILNDFLSLSKLEEGKVQCEPMRCTLHPFFQEILDELQGLLKPGQWIVYQPFEIDVEVFVDKKMLKNVLYNLLSNAIKYSPAGKPIDFKIELRSGKLYLLVRDYGIGIPEEEQQHLFSRFFRAHNVENIQGTGLGLNIVKRYLELMQGNITFESRLGEGTAFNVEIPVEIA